MKPFIAVLTIYCMIPGASEIVENVVHLVETGHTAHAFDDAEHDWDGTEHGCSGTYHVCSCCQSPSFVSPKLITSALPNPLADLSLLGSSDDIVADGFLVGVFRPPIA